jgi:ABC-type glycerol-3-phosphate transport system substrate-binding protein
VQSVETLDPAAREVHVWHSFTGPKEALLRELATQFEAANPYQVRLRLEYHSLLHQELLTSLSAGTPPDIVFARPDQIAEYEQADAVAPLVSYLTSATYGVNVAQQADLWPFVLQSGSRDAGAMDAHGVCFDSQAVVMFYHVGWLKRLKFSAPPASWDDMSKACKAARDRKAGTWGYDFVADGSTLVTWIEGLGGTPVSPKNRKPLLDSGEAIAAVSWLEQATRDGYVRCLAEVGADRDDFAAEKVLFTFGSTADLAVYAKAIMSTKSKKPRFDWDVAPLPHATGSPVVVVQGSVASVLRTTPRQQLAAWLFIRWLLQPENDLRWALATGAMPMNKSVQDLPEMQAYFKQNPQYKAACQLLKYAQTEPAVPKWSEMRNLLATAAASVCTGKASPADALAAADTAAEDLMVR